MILNCVQWTTTLHKGVEQGHKQVDTLFFSKGFNLSELQSVERLPTHFAGLWIEAHMWEGRVFCVMALTCLSLSHHRILFPFPLVRASFAVFTCQAQDTEPEQRMIMKIINLYPPFTAVFKISLYNCQIVLSLPS